MPTKLSLTPVADKIRKSQEKARKQEDNAIQKIYEIWRCPYVLGSEVAIFSYLMKKLGLHVFIQEYNPNSMQFSKIPLYCNLGGEGGGALAPHPNPSNYN